MNVRALIASLLFIAIVFAAISENFSSFVDIVSAIFVLVAALCFGSLCRTAHSCFRCDV